MNPGILIVGVFATEVILAFCFAAVAQLYSYKVGLDFRSIIKGVIERGFIFVALINDFPHAITFFSALKLATRLKRTDSDENHYNDYYLIGNLVSVGAAVGYVVVVQKFLQ
jgi:hypothetical protein